MSMVAMCGGRSGRRPGDQRCVVAQNGDRVQVASGVEAARGRARHRIRFVSPEVQPYPLGVYYPTVGWRHRGAQPPYGQSSRTVCRPDGGEIPACPGRPLRFPSPTCAATQRKRGKLSLYLCHYQLTVVQSKDCRRGSGRLSRHAGRPTQAVGEVAR